MIQLAAGDAIVEVLPDAGGRVAQIRVRGDELLVGPDADDIEGGADPMAWGCYPMVPWAGRIRHGLLLFDGRAYELPVRLGGHAIHGTGFVSAWEVLDAGLDHVELQCALDWPLGGTAHQHLQLTPDGLVLILSVVAGHDPMPVTIGWHPWFRKPVDVRLAFDAMYRRDDEHIPTGALVAPPPSPPWDDCFIGAHHPLQLHLAQRTITISSDCDHWVVFDHLRRGTCVEPQSGPPDAVNLGLAQRLEPGELLQRTMTIAWSG